MRVHVKLFAGLRERAGWSERELDGVDRVGGVWPALDLGDEPDGLLYAVNKEYADRNRPLVDGDEVALIPPVSGGAFRLSGEPLSLDAAVDEVRSTGPGRSRPSSARPACSRADTPSFTSTTRPTRKWPNRSWPTSARN